MAPVVPDFAWRADSPDGDRHAFPQRQDPGFPPPALCDVRWTVRMREHGSRYCDSCLGVLRRILAGASEALTEAEFTNSSEDLDAMATRDEVPEGEARAMWGNR